MKILLLGNYYPEHVGGIEFVTRALATNYRQRGHLVRWMACDVVEQPHVAASDDVPLSCWNWTEHWLGFPFPIPKPTQWLQIIREVQHCDVLHLHDCLYLANLIAFGAAKFWGKPILLTQHVGLVTYDSRVIMLLQQLAYAIIGRILHTYTTQTTFISQRIRAWFQTFVKYRTSPVYLPNGVDTQLFHPASNAEREVLRKKLGLHTKQPILLFVGRFVHKKGVHLLQPIVRSNPQQQWLFIGRDGDQNPAAWRLENVQVRQNCTQAQLREYYVLADMLILPSSGEGFPLVAQEAMACGLPVMLTEETASTLLPVLKTKADSTQIMHNINNALSQPEKLRQLGQQAHQFAKSMWSWDTISESYLKLLESITSESL